LRTGGKRKIEMKKTGKTKTTKKKKSPRRAARKKKPQPRRVEDEDFITGSIMDDYPAATARLREAEERRLGERMLQARELRGLTLEDLSSRTGIPVATLERVESNRAIPPLGALIRLGKALEMKMGHFISEGVDRPMTVVRAESRPKVARRGQKVREKYGYVYESLAPQKAPESRRLDLLRLVSPSPGEVLWEEARQDSRRDPRRRRLGHEEPPSGEDTNGRSSRQRYVSHSL
jgi:transcriptional regulator with XRE-family HTH domain